MASVSLLSIVIPIYNVEAVVAPLVKQLVAIAEHRAVELVFVDDGSTDDSASIVNDLIAEVPAASMLHQANAGLSAARNHGLTAATGEYVWFVDSDDLLNAELLPAVFETLQNKRPDLVQFGWVPFQDQPEFTHVELNWRQATGKQLFAELANNQLQNYPWAHICLRRLYQDADVQFPEGLLFEDMPTTFKLFLASDHALVTQAPVYAYRKRPNSIVNVVSDQSMQDLWRVAQMVTKDTATLVDRQHASQLVEMAQLIALGRTMEGTESPAAVALRKQILKAYCTRAWEHQGKALLKTRVRQLLMKLQLYVPISRRRLRAKL